MEDKKISISKSEVILFISAMVFIVISAVAIFVLDRYGLQGLFMRLFVGIMTLSIALICLITAQVWYKDIVNKIKEKQLVFKEYVKGMLILLRSIFVATILLAVFAAVYDAVRDITEGALITFIVFCILLFTFIFYIKYCIKRKSKQLHIVAAISLVMVILFSGTVAVNSIYTAVYDMVNRDTYSINVHSISVSWERMRKGGISYKLSAYDINNKQVDFSIEHETYDYFAQSESRREKAEIICYEKSDVIQSIKYKAI